MTTPNSSIEDNMTACSSAKKEEFLSYLELLRSTCNPRKWVTLIQCPTFSFDHFDLEAAKRRGYFAYPPRGLQCLKAVAEEFGVRVDILDLNFKILERLRFTSPPEPVQLHAMVEDILNAYLEERPECSIVGVSAGVTVPNVFSYQGHPYIHVLRTLMRKDRYIVLSGGPIATLERRNLLRLGLAHLVFKGEAEHKFRYFVAALFGLEGGQETPGIFFRLDDKLYETSGPPDTVSPKLDLVSTYAEIPVERYCSVGHVGPFLRMLDPDRRYATLQLVRGCRGHCTFCELAAFRGRSISHYPPDQVISEMRYLVKERGIRHFEWVDDDLLANREAATQVFKRIIDSGSKISWSANVGLIASSLNRELLQLMVDSGCVGFRIGIESGSEEILRRTRKPATKKKFLELAELFPEFPELFVVGCYMLGFEHETYQQIFETIRLALTLRLSWASIAVLQVTLESCVDSEFEVAIQENVNDYMPSYYKVKREEHVLEAGQMLSAREIFALPKDEVYARELLGEIWFAFNTVVNYVDNKNLKAGGNPEAFIGWVRGLQQSYPGHPLMSLFLYLAYVVKGDARLAQEYVKPLPALLERSRYWSMRFHQYGLERILAHPPRDAADVEEILSQLMEGYGIPAPEVHGVALKQG